MKKIYLKIKYNGKVIAKGYILDISTGGVGIGCKKKISEGTVVEMATETDILPQMKAKVVAIIGVRKKAYTYKLGLKFISRSRKIRKCLEEFIGSKEKRKVKRVYLNPYET